MLASGKQSNFYIDCKQAVLTAEGHFLVGTLICDATRDARPRRCRRWAALTMGADPLAAAVGRRARSLRAARSTPSTCARSRRATAPRSGSRATRRSRPARRSRSSRTCDHRRLDAEGDRARAAARARGRRVIALVDREEGGREAVEKEAPLTALFRKSDFAMKRGCARSPLLAGAGCGRAPAKRSLVEPRRRALRRERVPERGQPLDPARPRRSPTSTRRSRSARPGCARVPRRLRRQVRRGLQNRLENQADGAAAGAVARRQPLEFHVETSERQLGLERSRAVDKPRGG